MAQSTTETSHHIDVKRAVKSAREYIQHVYEGENALRGLMLEEVEISEDGQYWLITLGFDTDEPNPREYLTLAAPKYVRAYKIIQVRTDDGRAESMKIREL